MFSMMNDRFNCRPNRTFKNSAFLTSFGTRIWHISFFSFKLT